MSLLDCIVRIPHCLNNRLNSYEQLKSQIYSYLANNKIEELVIIASGSSMNASKVTKYFAKNVCRLNVTYYYPNEFVNYINHLNKKALYIVVSQGGATKLVYDALIKIQNQGLLNCSITEKLDSPIAKKASLAIEMGSENEEYLYRTIGYSTTVATISLIELCLGVMNNQISSESEILNDLSKAINNLDIIRGLTEKWYKNNKFSLMRRSKAILAGAECLHETSNEADIKMMEMVPMFTRSFELEELIHGPQNAFDDSTLFFILSDKRHDQSKVLHIAEFLKKEIGFCAIVGNQFIDERDLYFEIVSENFAMLEVITAFQVISYYLADDHGRDLSRGVNTSMQNYIKKTL